MRTLRADTYPASSSGPARPVSDRFAGTGSRIMHSVLVRTLICIAAPSLLLFRGSGELAGRAFWVALFALWLPLLAQRRRDEMLALLLGVLPFMNLLRGFFVFHIVGALIGASLAYWFVQNRGAWSVFRRTYALVLWLAAYFGLYWLATFAVTGEYDVNLRLMECIVGAVLVLVLSRNPAHLAAGLRGLLASVCVLGVVMLPHLHREGGQARLGMIELDDVTLGNPVQLGLPVALCFLALVVDRGFWLGLESRRAVRMVLLAPVAILLLLTTSRTAWLIVAAGVVCQLLFGRNARTGVAVPLVLVIIAFNVILITPLGDSLTASWERTFSEERTARNRTSGRSDQWLVSYHAVTQSPEAFLFGYGPGSGPRVYARKSLEVRDVAFGAGSELHLHSLYMQAGVEIGVLGLLPLLVILVAAGRQIVGWTRATHRLLPAAAFLGYVIIAGTVSGGDISSGAYLGLGLLAAVRVPSKAGQGRAAAAPGAYPVRRHTRAVS